MQAVILSIGDELVLGQSLDTNSAYLSAQLASRGIGTRYHQTVADDLPTLVTALKQAAQSASLVIVTGGLGPTEDDLTRQALADAMGVPLVEDAASVEQIRAYFTRLGRQMPDRNKVQALCPRGAAPIENTCGTAPGIRAVFGQATIFVTPGVPREMVAMFQKSIVPELDRYGADRGVILTKKINTFGTGESTVGEKLGSLMARDRNPKVGTTVADGVVSIRIRAEFPTQAQAQQQMDDTVTQIEGILGPIVYSEESVTMQEALVALLKKKGITVTTAESCTGGMLGAMFTDVPGSSAVFRGGWVVYSNLLKQSQLNVSEAQLKEHGAVSAPVAITMAQTALSRSGADYALSITGVAGPDGGSAEKPVGTVFIGIASRKPLSPSGLSSDAVRCQLTGDRDQVRDRAAKSAMTLLRYAVLGLPLETFTWGTCESVGAKQTV